MSVKKSGYKDEILIFIYTNFENEEIPMTKLQDIVTSYYSVTSAVNKLCEQGLLTKREVIQGRKTIMVSLTPKGRQVAEQLKKAQEIAENPDIGNSPIKIEEDAAIRVKELRLLYHVNVLDDHVTIEEIPHNGRPRIFNVYVRRNGHGDFRLWCEQDNSFDCVHAEVAWTYPEVQHMILHYKGKTKVCPVCAHENSEKANFCENCGARLE